MGRASPRGLALALLLTLRDQKVNLPKATFLISPWLDLKGTGESMTKNDGRDIWFTKKHIDLWATWYVGNADRMNPYISPVYGDLKNLCPIIVFSGDQEVLFDDSTRLAKANSNIDLYIGKDMHHGWMISFAFLKDAKRAWEVLKKFLQDKIA